MLHYTFYLPAPPFSVSPPCSSPPPHPCRPSINMQRHIELCLSSTSRASHVLADMHEDEALGDTNLVNCDSIQGRKSRAPKLGYIHLFCVCVCARAFSSFIAIHDENVILFLDSKNFSKNTGVRIILIISII